MKYSDFLLFAWLWGAMLRIKLHLVTFHGTSWSADKLFRKPSRIYIYIYIYCHPQTDCFVVSQRFSVAKEADNFKPGSKPA